MQSLVYRLLASAFRLLGSPKPSPEHPVPPAPERQETEEYGPLRISRTPEGVSAFLSTCRTIGKSYELYGEWGREEWSFLGQFLRSGDAVVDAGANQGSHSLAFARAVGPHGHVLAIEPQSFLCHVVGMQAALNLITNIRIVNAGLGSTNGKASIELTSLHQPTNLGMYSLSSTDTSTATPSEVVAVHTLDSLLRTQPAYAGTEWALIKVDVEGSENDVLIGAEETIRASQPVLYLEFNREAQMSRMVNRLRSWEYAIFYHKARAYSPDNVYGNPVDVWEGGGDRNIVAIPLRGPDVRRRLSIVASEGLPRLDPGVDAKSFASMMGSRIDVERWSEELLGGSTGTAKGTAIEGSLVGRIARHIGSRKAEATPTGRQRRAGSNDVLRLLVADRGRHRRASGYGMLSRQIIRGLAELGHDVYIEPVTNEWERVERTAADFFAAFPTDTTATRQADAVLQIGPPGAACSTPRPSLIYTQHALSELPEAWVRDLRRVDGVIVPGKYDYDVFSSDLPRVWTAPQASPHELFKYRPDWRPEGHSEFTFLFVGSYHYRKGVDLLLRAFLTEFSSDEEVRLQMQCPGIGTGEEFTHLLHTLQRFNPMAKVSVSGSVLSPEWMARLYNRVDAVVTMSRGEGWCMPLAEALLCRRPVIAPSSTGMREFIDDTVAFTVATKEVPIAEIDDPYADSFVRAYGGGKAVCHEADMASARAALRKAFVEREEATDRAKRGHQRMMDDFNRSRMSWAIDAAIRECLKLAA